MSLLPCRECDRKVSTEAETCPRCGCPKPVVIAPVLELLGRDHRAVTDVLGVEPRDDWLIIESLDDPSRPLTGHNPLSYCRGGRSSKEIVVGFDHTKRAVHIEVFLRRGTPYSAAALPAIGLRIREPYGWDGWTLNLAFASSRRMFWLDIEGIRRVTLRPRHPLFAREALKISVSSTQVHIDPDTGLTFMPTRDR